VHGPRAGAESPEATARRARARAEAEEHDDQAAQANNPLANLTAFSVQNYYVPELSGTDEGANQLWFRYAQPVSAFGGDWLLRASLPLNRFPTGPNEAESGVGDANVFATWLFDTGNPTVSVGAGPLVGIPSAREDALGTDQWSAGGAVVFFDASRSEVQSGGLVTYQTKVGGSDRVEDVNLLAIQPFGFLQLGNGTYLRAAPIWVFDLETGDHSVPVGLGVGKVVRLGTTVLNFFVEPQFSVLDEGPGQPEFQLFSAPNLQFYPDE